MGLLATPDEAVPSVLCGQGSAPLAVEQDRSLTPGEMPQDIERHLAPERMMKHYFIVSDVYGTRSSTVLMLRRDGSIYFSERQYNDRGQATGTRRFLL